MPNVISSKVFYRPFNLFLVLCFVLSGIACNNGDSGLDLPTESTEVLFDLSLTDAERDSLQDGLRNFQRSYKTIHQQDIDNSVYPSLLFHPIPTGFDIPTKQEKLSWNLPRNVKVPENLESLAFYTVAELASLLKSRKITSVKLTEMYLNRLKEHDKTLFNVVINLFDLTHCFP